MTAPEKRWHTREDSGLRLDAELNWWHDNERIVHPKIIEAFNAGLRPAGDGRFELHLGNDWARVDVEDAAYGVTRARLEGSTFQLELTDRTEEPLVPETLSADAEGVLRCQVKGGQARARFSREAQFTVGAQLEHGDAGWTLQLGDIRVSLPGLKLAP